MVDGFINVYKEQGYTSFDVVAKLRGILKQKKIGHTGTLDPLAEGVLLVCLGKATKLVDMLNEKNKEYECVMLLGKTSDTEDISGQIKTSTDIIPEKEQVKAVIDSFVGEYGQIPPMYSAIKVNGKKLYELARKGIEIEREPRPVWIYSIEILEMDLPRVRFNVKCSKGTYIRSLCRDIGEKLSCGALMEKLIRTEVKGYRVEDSLTLDQIEQLTKAGELEKHVQSMDMLLGDLPKLHINEQSEKFLSNGNKLIPDNFLENNIIYDTNLRVYNSSDDFVALYYYDKEKMQYVPYKMFL